MTKTIHKNFMKKAIIWSVIIFFWLSTVYALNSWNTWYKVNNGVSNAKVYVAGTSNYRIVTNTKWVNLFVPSKTTGEMDAFCNNPSWTSCYTCSVWGWVNNWARWWTIDHDTGAGSINHTQAWCTTWCRGILDGWKYNGWHLCVRRWNGRCHLYRDESTAVGPGGESGRSYQLLSCSTAS